jgi:hypothetical protein
MHPDDAQTAMDRSFGPRLMLDWYEPCDDLGNDSRVYVLAPASLECEGEYAPEISFWDFLMGGVACKGACTFLKDGLCEIHTSGFKPLQCRVGSNCGQPFLNNIDMARYWMGEAGAAAVARWCEINGHELPDDSGYI